MTSNGYHTPSSAASLLDDGPDEAPAVTIARLQAKVARLTHERQDMLELAERAEKLLSDAQATAKAALEQRDAARADAETLSHCLTLVMPSERAMRMTALNFAWDEIISSGCQRRDWEAAARALAAHRKAK